MSFSSCLFCNLFLVRLAEDDVEYEGPYDGVNALNEVTSCFFWYMKIETCVKLA